MKTIDIKKILIDKALVIVLLFMIIGIIIIEPSFLQWRVFTDIITQSAVKMICALGPDFYSFIIKTPYIARKYSICRVFLVLCSFP